MKVSAFSLFLVLLLSHSHVYSQQEYNQWVVAAETDTGGLESLRIDFNSGQPVLVDTIDVDPYFVFYKPSVLCDKNGKLLYFFDNYRIWNDSYEEFNNYKLEYQFINSIFLPDPSDSSIYWYFKVRHRTVSEKPMHYYKIDKHLNNGKGDISGG